MARIAVLSGSARAGSHNVALVALAADRLRAAGAEVTHVDLAALDLPLYAHEIEMDAFPAAARELKAIFQAQDGLLIASPEYNGSVTPLLKNALDWASRPTDGEGLTALSAYRGKVAGVMSASIGPFGGLRGLIQLRQILVTMQLLVIPEQVMVPSAHAAFDDTGALKDELPGTLLDAMCKRLNTVADALR